MEAIIKRLKGDERGISNIIVVMLSLVLIVVIVANVVLWSYQMNQFDWEKMQENINTVDVVSGARSYNPSGCALGGSTSWVSESISNLASDDGVYMTFRSYATATSPQTLYAHAETTTIGYLLKLVSADLAGTSLSASTGSTGRQLFGKFVYQLTGVSSIPASTWTLYYRAWHSTVSSEILTLRPNAPGTYTEWTTVYPSGTLHWDAVDDVTSDDDATCIETTTVGHRDTFHLTDIPSQAHSITSVKVYAVARKTAAPAVTLQIGIRSGTTDSWATAVSLTTTYATYSAEWTTDPATGGAWTISAVNALEAGVRHASDAGRAARVTQVYVEVTCKVPPVAHVDMDVLIRQSDGTVRQTIATDVANSPTITETATTYSATYAWSSYTVIDHTDYLDIDYYRHVVTAKSGVTAYLRIDDNTLAVIDQTRITNIILPNEFTTEVEFTGSSNMYDWTQLVWIIDSCWTTGGVSVTLQLYNYILGAYPTNGDGYIAYISSATPNTDESKNQTIVTNPTHFRDASGNWKMRVKAVKPTNNQFDFKADWIEFKPAVTGTHFTFQNRGSLTSHLVSLWVNNLTNRQRYDINLFVNPGENVTYTRMDINLPTENFMVKVVTERGNIAVFADHQ